MYSNEIINFFLKKENILYKKIISFIHNSHEIREENSVDKIPFKFDNLMEFLKYLNDKKYNVFRFIFHYAKEIHKLLYDFEENINLDSFDIKKELNVYFYLYILINEESEIVNYSYSFNFINNLNNFNNSLDKKLTKIVFSKIIIKLINNFKDLEDYEEEKYEEKLELIENENLKIIKDNIEIFKDLNLELNIDYFLEYKIEVIYSEIIISLFKLKKITNLDYSLNIIKELDLENIYITKTIFDNLREVLNSKEDFINEYIISNKEDLLNENKINFYYILFKYILKDPIYIYQIQFLYKMRKEILKIIKANDFSYNNINIDIKNKLEYILKTFADSDFYFKRNNSDILKLKEVLNYYKKYLFESKKEYIDIIENIIKNGKGDYNKYLEEYEIAKEMNNKYPIIIYLNKSKINKNILKEKEIKEFCEYFKKIEKMLKEKKIHKKMRKSDKQKIIEYFHDENNKEKLIEIYGEDIYNFIINLNQNEKKENKNKVEEEKMNNVQINEIKMPEQYDDNAPPVIIKNIKNNGIDNSNKNQEKNSSKNNNENNVSKASLNSTKPKTNNSIIDKDYLLLKNELENNNSAPLIIDEINKYKGFEELIKNILKKSSINLHVDKEKEPNFVIDEVNYGDLNITIDVKKFLESLSIYNNIKKENENNLVKNYKKFYSFLKEFKDRIISSYKNNYILKIKLEFNYENETNIDDNIDKITCKYIFYEPKFNNPITFLEDNILINGTNSNIQGFEFMIFEINNECYNKNYQIINSKNNNNEINNNNKNEAMDNSKDNSSKKDDNNKNEYIIVNSTKNKIFKKVDEFKIIEHRETIDKENSYNGIFKELSTGNYVSFRRDNNIVIYDSYFNQVMEIKENLQNITNINERINYDNKDDKSCQLIIAGRKDLILLTLDLKKYKYSIKGYNINNIYTVNCFELKKNNYIILGKNLSAHDIDLFVNNQIKQNNIVNKSYIGSIKINENIIALTSNRFISNGENKLIFYNTNSKKVSNEIEGHSFIMSPNGLSLITRKEQSKKKNIGILLCACKQYDNGQKNGILLVNPNLGDNKNVENPFYDTENFVPHCFCPILNYKEIKDNEKINYNNIEEFRENIIIEDTNYFFVGGFDEEKRLGSIKLYKINFTDKAYNTTIDYIQDIEFENEEEIGFLDGPINCIIQSKQTGNILATNYNGNIYLFSRPNLDYFFPKKEKKSKLL